MNKKNWLLLFFACAIAFASFNSCKKDDNESESGDTGPTEWRRSVVFDGQRRSGAASFTSSGSGAAAYVVGGYTSAGFVTDAFKFDGATWAPIKEFPGQPRHEAVGFFIGGKGYVGTGHSLVNGVSEDFNDFYSYDPATNEWEEIAPFPGDARYGAVAFTLGNYAYVGLGRAKQGSTDYSNFYRYNPSNDTWTPISSPFKYKKAYAFAFVIGDKAYVGGGQDGGTNALPEDFYSFDGSEWEPLNDLNRSDDNYTYDARKYAASAFSIGNYGYVISGRNASTVTSTVWKYDPATDSWTDKHEALSSDPREKSVGFSLNGKGYITTGLNGSRYFDSTFEFIPVR
ncbi:Kelch repeat-containing protein [Sphingobacterium sp. FBM7-1]|uniref:Kelch repeat-containing protein n=1 Tax=Sphingobacterium sp. FBM7-1 TaxID=2886688 RepID=UPI001D11E4E1|nr:kelch repeat-containing protein [Sphingobacterium sp. FBM7-1]MCC2600486.1 hypothetical protein [Sphingobacterium sp. FBM7-1]